MMVRGISVLLLSCGLCMAQIVPNRYTAHHIPPTDLYLFGNTNIVLVVPPSLTNQYKALGASWGLQRPAMTLTQFMTSTIPAAVVIGTNSYRFGTNPTTIDKTFYLAANSVLHFDSPQPTSTNDVFNRVKGWLRAYGRQGTIILGGCYNLNVLLDIGVLSISNKGYGYQLVWLTSDPDVYHPDYSYIREFEPASGYTMLSGRFRIDTIPWSFPYLILSNAHVEVGIWHRLGQSFNIFSCTNNSSWAAHNTLHVRWAHYYGSGAVWWHLDTDCPFLPRQAGGLFIMIDWFEMGAGPTNQIRFLHRNSLGDTNYVRYIIRSNAKVWSTTSQSY